MKKVLIYCCAGLLGACLTGCGSMRAEQNPQPKKQYPCREWQTMCEPNAANKPSAANKSEAEATPKEIQKENMRQKKELHSKYMEMRRNKKR